MHSGRVPRPRDAPLGRHPAIASAEITDHRHADLGARLRLRDHEGGMDELRHFARTPLEDALLVRLRLRNATELGEQAMTGIGSEQPIERGSFPRVRLAIQLYRRDGELSVNQILGSSSRSDSSRIREASSLLERLVREDARATACSFGTGLRSHPLLNRLPKTSREPPNEHWLPDGVDAPFSRRRPGFERGGRPRDVRVQHLFGKPALAVAGVFAFGESRVRLFRVGCLLIDARAVAERDLVHAVAAPVRPVERSRAPTASTKQGASPAPTMACFVPAGQCTRSTAGAGAPRPRR